VNICLYVFIGAALNFSLQAFKWCLFEYLLIKEHGGREGVIKFRPPRNEWA